MASIIIDIDTSDDAERMSLVSLLDMMLGKQSYQSVVRSSGSPAAFRDDAIKAMRGDWGYEDGEYPTADEVMTGTTRSHGYAQGQCVAIAYTFGVPSDLDGDYDGAVAWVWEQILPKPVVPVARYGIEFGVDVPGEGRVCIYDVGQMDSLADAASWALANRGLPAHTVRDGLGFKDGWEAVYQDTDARHDSLAIVGATIYKYDDEQGTFWQEDLY